MRLELNPLKLVLMAWPIYLMMAAGAALNPSQWWPPTPTTGALLCLPLVFFVAGLALRDHWRLELTPDALVHHRLFGADVFPWERMGPVELRAQHIVHLPLVRTLWFPFPLDAPRTPSERVTKLIGRRLLLIFGDRNGPETMRLIEAWRTGSRMD